MQITVIYNEVQAYSDKININFQKQMQHMFLKSCIFIKNRNYRAHRIEYTEYIQIAPGTDIYSGQISNEKA